MFENRKKPGFAWLMPWKKAHVNVNTMGEVIALRQPDVQQVPFLTLIETLETAQKAAIQTATRTGNQLRNDRDLHDSIAAAFYGALPAADFPVVEGQDANSLTPYEEALQDQRQALLEDIYDLSNGLLPKLATAEGRGRKLRELAVFFPTVELPDNREQPSLLTESLRNAVSDVEEGLAQLADTVELLPDEAKERLLKILEISPERLAEYRRNARIGLGETTIVSYALYRGIDDIRDAIYLDDGDYRLLGNLL